MPCVILVPLPSMLAVLNTPLAALRKTLSRPAQWCDLAILHIIIKTCLYGVDQVKFFVGRKYYQTPDEAYELQYHFTIVANSDNYLNIKLNAPDGPPVLFQCDITGFSWSVSVQGKARLAANGHSPLQEVERSHGR